MNTLYYAPEKFGLRIVAEVDDPEACWSFDMLVLWQHTETGRLYYLDDAGCSCPSPFENATDLGAAHELNDTAESVAAYEAWVDNWLDWRHKAPSDEVQMLRHKMKVAAYKALHALAR